MDTQHTTHTHMDNSQGISYLGSRRWGIRDNSTAIAFDSGAFDSGWGVGDDSSIDLARCNPFIGCSGGKDAGADSIMGAMGVCGSLWTRVESIVGV
jgi:hypothetical protein